ncbi:Predicted PurR-regulated permease PerM [Halomicrobium zhouii]|uniref:Predicted PurR-regulated permease PerM n=1 Tax=Halomicrobium zhouii TaxID=767519 RepID=A0A1I6KM86_9EURY|nr:AI-2E family transporter [Halomicrobium zhouii]SFR92326.1 Predicted PurR-regulated permease PerM [Halomicrobium zhouii]
MDSSRGFLLLVVTALLALSALFVLPFLQYFLLAVVLAYVLAPVQARAEQWASPRIAAGAVVALASVAVILPLVVVTRAVAADAAALVEGVQQGGESVAELEAAIEALVGADISFSELLQSVVSNGGSEAFGSILGVFGAVTHAVIGLGLTIFLLYYFLKDGDDFVAWLRWVLPLPADVLDELFDAIDDITWAVLAGHVFIAIVQGAIAGLGLFAVGIPNALFWTSVMIVLALLPIVGSFLVWGPSSVYLVLVGRPVPAALLFAYGTIIVGISDDYLRPVVVDRYARLNPSVIILGVVGGLYAIGFMGLFVGPIIIGALRATLDVYREQYAPEVDG